MLRFSMLLVTALAVCTTGCDSCRKPAKIKCSLSPALKKKLLARRTVDLSQAERRQALRQVLKRCGPMPGYMRKYLALQSEEPGTGSVLLSAKAHWERADYRRDMERLCPGYEKKLVAGGSVGPAERRKIHDRMYRRCKLGRFGLFSEQEFWSGSAYAFVAVTLYQGLRRGGVDKALARRISRLVLNVDRVATLVGERKLQLPVSSSFTPVPEGAVTVAVSPKGVSVQGQRVTPPKAVASRLLAALKRHPQYKVLGRLDRLPVLVLVDRRVTSGRALQILGFLRSAGVRQVQLGARQPGGDIVGPVVSL